MRLVDRGKNSFHGLIEKLEISQFLLIVSTSDLAELRLLSDDKIEKPHDLWGIIILLLQFELNFALHDEIMLVIAEIVDFGY